jgi:tRNA threonylcarbamoyladenosine biosynthesis protein TsaE
LPCWSRLRSVIGHIHQLETAGPAETEALGAAWGAKMACSGRSWLVGLSGDLGAGKTQLARGLVRGLGYGGRISSPTYGLINEYQTTPISISHLDLYRLDGPEQIVASGLESSLVCPEGVTIVEWIERRWPWAATLVVPDHLKIRGCARFVRIDAPTETSRRIRYVDLGL